MGSIDRRIFELEKLLAETRESEPSEEFENMNAILREFATLKASCARVFAGACR